MRIIQNMKLYAKVFALLTVSTSITIFALSTFLYFHFEEIVLKQSYQSTVNSLKQTTHEASIMTVTADALVKQIYNDKMVNKLLNFSALDTSETRDAIDQLDAYRATSPFIDSLYVYNGNKDEFYISTDLKQSSVQPRSEFYDKDVLLLFKGDDQKLTLKPIPRKIPIPPNSDIDLEKNRDVYTYLLYDTLNQGERRNLIIVNVSETQMHKFVDGLISNSVNNTFIIDEEGTLISNTWKLPMLSNLSDSSYIRRIIEGGVDSGYFSADVDKTHSLVTYTAPDYLGWRYIRITSYSALTHQINMMRWKTVIITVGLLLFGLFISYMASRKFFEKVDEKLSKLPRLEKDRRDSFQALRQDFVENLLTGNIPKNMETLQSKLDHLEIPFSTQHSFRVVLMRIDHYSMFSERFDDQDRKLFKFGILNVAQEWLAPVCQTYALDLSENRLAIIFSNNDLERIPAEEELNSLFMQIQKTVQSIFNLEISVFVSDSGEDIFSINELYMETLQLSYYRIFYESSCILWPDLLKGRATSSYDYSSHKEKQLIDLLKLGRMEPVKQLLTSILMESSQSTYMAFHFTLTKLIHVIHNAITTIEKNGFSSFQLDFHTLLASVNQADSLREIEEQFFRVFDGIESTFEDKKLSKQDNTVQKIMEIIHQRFSDRTLSLESIAEAMNMSTTSISRVFKKATFKTILNYIIEVRMDEVSKLLLHSNESIGEIAERAGFSNSPHFYKSFKQYFGVTPTEYRKNAADQNND
ncbi:helix-turn-helix transcriptional regulator [Paenibacillus sp. MMO-177]|uniref:helix-turn-helix transcriptional regulator n=1 Tax=Paenibacillus sp. MMO-177 TaxID=3081289 RepID=UPI00301A9C41